MIRLFRSAGFLLLAALGTTSHAFGQADVPDSSATVLEPGDILRVAIWREPDLSGEFVIQSDGTVTLPLLGNVDAVNLSVSALEEKLEESYRRDLRNPSIEITPLRQIFMLGDVARPGLYTVPPTTTLAGAVAMAGGASPIGDLRNLSVYRDGEQLYQGISMESAVNLQDLRSGDQIYVGRISWVRRNVQYVVGVGFTVLGLVLQFVR